MQLSAGFVIVGIAMRVLSCGDPRTGQVRGFLRDLPATTPSGTGPLQRAIAEGLEILLSHGIPSAEAWRR